MRPESPASLPEPYSCAATAGDSEMKQPQTRPYMMPNAICVRCAIAGVGARVQTREWALEGRDAAGETRGRGCVRCLRRWRRTSRPGAG